MVRTGVYKKECEKTNLGIIFEFTAPGTLQQNSVAGRRIPTLMGRARSMLIQAGIESSTKENSGVKSFPQQQSWIT